MTDLPKFRYFSPMPGMAVARYGTSVHIGATRTPTGFVINPDEVVAIPERETAMYAREYMDAVRNKELRERTVEDFNLQQAQVAEREAQDQRDREAAQKLLETTAVTVDGRPVAGKVEAFEGGEPGEGIPIGGFDDPTGAERPIKKLKK